MPVALDDLRVLLIQVRDTDELARHEQVCVMEQTGLRADQIDPVNVVREPVPDADRASRAHMVIIGGAGAHSACDDDPFTPALLDFTRRIAGGDQPVLGCCWGHQFIARALGGVVIHDPDRAEVGTVELELTPAGLRDPVLGVCPPRFPALAGHKDRVSVLPPGAVSLAHNPGHPNQAFRIEGKLIWGTQFHSELSPERLLERLSVYRQYVPDDAEYEALRRRVGPTPHARLVMRRFLEFAAPQIRN